MGNGLRNLSERPAENFTDVRRERNNPRAHDVLLSKATHACVLFITFFFCSPEIFTIVRQLKLFFRKAERQSETTNKTHARRATARPIKHADTRGSNETGGVMISNRHQNSYSQCLCARVNISINFNDNIPR